MSAHSLNFNHSENRGRSWIRPTTGNCCGPGNLAFDPTPLLHVRTCLMAEKRRLGMARYSRSNVRPSMLGSVGERSDSCKLVPGDVRRRGERMGGRGVLSSGPKTTNRSRGLLFG